MSKRPQDSPGLDQAIHRHRDQAIYHRGRVRAAAISALNAWDYLDRLRRRSQWPMTDDDRTNAHAADAATEDLHDALDALVDAAEADAAEAEADALDALAAAKADRDAEGGSSPRDS